MSFLKAGILTIVLMSLSLPCLAKDSSIYTGPDESIVAYNSQTNVSKKGPGEIFICSKHKDVDVYVDEDKVGKTPVILTTLPKGRHLVEIYDSSELVYRQYITVKNGERILINIDGEKNIAGEDLKFII